MDVIQLFVALILFSLGWWVLGQLIDDAKLLKIMRVVLVVILSLFLLTAIFGPIGTLHIGR